MQGEVTKESPGTVKKVRMELGRKGAYMVGNSMEVVRDTEIAFWSDKWGGDQG